MSQKLKLISLQTVEKVNLSTKNPQDFYDFIEFTRSYKQYPQFVRTQLWITKKFGHVNHCPRN